MRKVEFISELGIYQLLKKDSSLDVVCISVCLFVCLIAVVPVSPFCHFRQHSQVRTKLANAMLMYDGNTNDTQLPYFPAHKTHRDFFFRNFRKKNDECILILVIYLKETGLLHTKISNNNIIYLS